MMKNNYFLLFFALFSVALFAQEEQQESTYKKRVLETTEVDLLSSYYSQDGNNAAVSGGIGTEELTDATGTIVVAIPLNDDDVLTIDAGVSAYTSASSSNINPFDGANLGAGWDAWRGSLIYAGSTYGVGADRHRPAVRV